MRGGNIFEGEKRNIYMALQKAAGFIFFMVLLIVFIIFFFLFFYIIDVNKLIVFLLSPR